MGQDKIPITFEYEGKQYSGHFSQVSGAASSGTFHLMIDHYYCGQLILTENFGWQFTSQTKKFQELSDFFGQYIEAWVE